MRKIAFNATASVFAFTLQAITLVSGLMQLVVGKTGHFLMKTIDGDRLKFYEQLITGQEEELDGSTELSRQSMELRLLASAAQVRDHARDTSEWTDRHTEALNAIGDALLVESGWEEEAVHQYLKELVESIDGLEYDAED